MIYRVFASKLNSTEEIEAYRYKNRFWTEKYYSEFREIKANSKNQAKEIFSKRHKDLVDNLGLPVHYFFVDENGRILE